MAIAHDGDVPRLVLDAGTGLRRLTAILDGTPFDGTIVLTHLHWHHMMGLPFFGAGGRDEARVRLIMPDQDGTLAEAMLRRTMSPPTFPITPAHDPSRTDDEVAVMRDEVAAGSDVPVVHGPEDAAFQVG